MSNEDKNIGGSLILDLRKWWRHVQAKNTSIININCTITRLFADPSSRWHCELAQDPLAKQSEGISFFLPANHNLPWARFIPLVTPVTCFNGFFPHFFVCFCLFCFPLFFSSFLFNGKGINKIGCVILSLSVIRQKNALQNRRIRRAESEGFNSPILCTLFTLPFRREIGDEKVFLTS